jgi:hypothetical protein
MVDERDEGESQEEGEYHFSDDQANYDMEMDPSAKEGASAVAAAPKESIADKLKQHRRIVIGIVVFIVLLGIVYKLVTPSSTPTTEFQQPAPASSAKAPVKAVTPPPAATQAPASAPGVSQTAQTVQPVAQPVMPAPVMSQPTTAGMPPQAVETQPAAPTTETSTTTTVTTTAPPAPQSVLDRVATLEQQNSAMMNLMQTQYAQKISDTELQNNQLRTEVQELSTRISNMEVAFRQLTKMLGNRPPAMVNANRSRSEAAAVPARIMQPKISYTVQAIIPGRAWLKSDSGDTVTVAEGDTLKGYGRITKIDPYDGVVDIDTGSKVISLSYGLSGD